MLNAFYKTCLIILQESFLKKKGKRNISSKIALKYIDTFSHDLWNIYYYIYTLIVMKINYVAKQRMCLYYSQFSQSVYIIL